MVDARPHLPAGSLLARLLLIGPACLGACDGEAVNTAMPEEDLHWVRPGDADAVLYNGRGLGNDTCMIRANKPGSSYETVRGSGDCTGDGVPDILTTIDMDWEESGERRTNVVLVPGPVHRVEDVSAGIPFILPWSATSYVWNGDTNGDGINDVLVATDYGPAYLFEGPFLQPVYEANAALVVDIEPSTSKSTERYDPAARILDGGKDIDGDGLDDFLVGDRAEYSLEVDDESAVYIFHGGRSSQDVLHAEDADVAILADSDFARPGYYGAILADDLTGDGRPDVVVTAAPWSGGVATHENKVVAILEGGVDGTRLLDERVATIPGFSTSIYPDWIALATADVDRDGFNELFVASRSYYFDVNDDRLRLFEGPFEGELDPEADASWGFIDDGVEFPIYIHTGIGLDAAGDINADGSPDLLIATEDLTGKDSYYLDMGYPGVGTAFVCTRFDDGCVNATNADIRIRGSGGQLGYHLIHVGDVSGDGFDDFMATAPYAIYQVHWRTSGVRYLFYGGPDVVERLMGEPP